MYSVYCHINRSNGKKYVGITSINPVTRWGVNGCRYRGCTAFYGAIQKYGWDGFDHYILKRDCSREVAEALEKQLIRDMRTSVPNGYNLERGGLMNVEVSEATREKIRESNRNRKWTPEQTERMRIANLGSRNPNYGKIASAETRRKQSEAHKGRKQSPEHVAKKSGANSARARAVIQYDLNGVELRRYDTVGEAMRTCGSTHISECCRNPHRISAGYRWAYAEKGEAL